MACPNMNAQAVFQVLLTVQLELRAQNALLWELKLGDDLGRAAELQLPELGHSRKLLGLSDIDAETALWAGFSPSCSLYMEIGTRALPRLCSEGQGQYPARYSLSALIGTYLRRNHVHRDIDIGSRCRDLLNHRI